VSEVLQSTPERGIASLVAAAVGDALGWPQEPRGGLVGGKRARSTRPPVPVFSAWPRNAGSRFLRYKELVLPGEYSDDTQLLLAVARACLHTDWRQRLIEAELPSWPVYQRGGGRAVLAAANTWASARSPWDPRPDSRGQSSENYFAAGANGAAMRIAPHVLWTLANGHEDVLRHRVVQDATLTHGHPRAIIGALCLATGLWAALTSRSPLRQDDLITAAYSALVPIEAVADAFPIGWANPAREEWFADTWQSTVREMADLLDTASRSLRRGSMSNVTDTLNSLGATGQYSGSGTNSVAAALYLASRAGSRPMSGLLQAAFETDIDTDTVASMTGSLLGATHGMRWLEPLLDVQDMRYVADLAGRLLGAAPHHNPPPGPSVSARSFTRDLDLGSREGWFPDGREYTVIERELIGENPWVVRHRLRLADGQTVIVDRARRTPPTSTEAEALRPRVPQGGIAGVTLPTRNLRATRAFYQQLFGRTLEVTENGALALGEHLSFIEVPDTKQTWTPDAQVTIQVNDTRHVATQVAGARQRMDGSVLVTDPDGRLVVVVPHAN
jgi:ADP-ribosylglycohydrolase